MKLKEIHRTSTIAWSPLSTPLLATGTVAGALDESFSNDSQLEIWAPDFLNKQEYDLGGEGHNGPRGSVANTARFNRIAWGQADGSRPEGVIAAGMENGELTIWDPSKIVAQVSPSDALILKNSTHTGPVRGLDFNPIQSTLFASGGINGEVYIWDLKDPSKPYSPGTRSSKLDEVSALAWNNQVPHVLATSSGTGYTVVWDLRGKREVVALAYGGAAGGAQAASGRRGMSDVAWHPDNATRLVTSSEDDTSPIVMVWDLRNARAPEKILTGHEKGVLSLSWCKQDADLLLSSGKDNRALCWNPQTSEIIGELPSADNWAFQVQWCPRNPDLLATAFFDGTIGLHSIQSTDVPQSEIGITTPQPDGADVFDNPSFARTNQASFTLKQPPKWLCRPASASFGYCGQLVSVSNLMTKEGRYQSAVVHIRKLVTEHSVVSRAERLVQAVNAQELPAIASERSAKAENLAAESAAGWKALFSLFRADSRDELVTLLGFSKAGIAERVAEAIAKLRSAAEEESTPLTVVKSASEEDFTDYKPHEPIVSFAEPERSPTASAEDLLDATPSEVSAGAASDTSHVTPLPDAESTTTAPSLFGDDGPAGTPQLGSAADFFSAIGLNQSASDDVPVIPHTSYGVDSSVAATVGSRPSSAAASDTLKSHTFRIYPADESDTDRLVTKALVVGDFESAVSLCLSMERFADAILLAAKGGPDLLTRTQKAYFERRTVALPYLRLFQSVVTNDLADIVQNADLQDWQEIFVVLCTFAGADEFGGLAEQLGARLEFQASLARSEHATEAPELRKNATLAYLAAGRLERLVNIWVEELAEEEQRILADEAAPGISRYTAHTSALQTFVEKVTVFRAAASYVDKDLEKTEGGSAAGAYKLAGLYDRYFEYADFLATQGLVGHAVGFLKLTPPGYKGLPDSQLDVVAARERLLVAAGVANPAVVSSSLASVPTPASIPSLPAVPMAPSNPSTSTHMYNPYAPITQHQAARTTAAALPAPSYDSYAPANVSQVASNPYTPAQPPQPQQPYQPIAPPAYPSGNVYSQLPPQPGQVLPPPPQPYGATKAPPPIAAPPPKRRENGGWNDAPSVPERRTPSGSVNKLQAITSPFPNAGQAQGSAPSSMYARGQSPVSVPPPPRPGSVQGRAPPPPSQGRIPVPPSYVNPAPGPYVPSGAGQVPLQGAPPPNVIPPGQQLPPRQPPAGQYAPPPQRVTPAPPPPPNPYSRGTPPPSHGAGVPQASPPQGRQAPLPPLGPYGRGASPLQQSSLPGMAPPPPSGPARAPPPPGGLPQGLIGQSAAVNPQRTASQGPPPPKYTPGDRSHIPDSQRPIYNVVGQQLNHLKQTTHASQRRLVDDLERRINPLFDALNCETLSASVVGQLGELTKAMANHDRELALAIHVDMLTRTSGEDITLWMSGIKQLIMRL